HCNVLPLKKHPIFHRPSLPANGRNRLRPALSSFRASAVFRSHFGIVSFWAIILAKTLHEQEQNGELI
ncbi:hypothetical protein, partial [Paenibacillus elgii]